jgi:hypothetical protein
MKDKTDTFLIIKENIIINFTGSTGPGLSWMYRIEIRLEKSNIEIWFSRDLDEYDLSIFSTIPNSSTFPELIRALDKIEGGIGGNLFNKIKCDGAPTPWDELLVMSLFSEIDEIRYDKLALALIEMDYGDMIKLHKNYGSFRDDTFVNHMLEIVDFIEDLNISSMREAILVSKVKDQSNLKTFIKKLKKASEKIYKDQASMFAPFNALAKKMINNWETANPKSSPTSRYAKWGANIRHEKIGILEEYIHSYTIKHGELPSGIHRLDKHGNLNFDSLKKS